VPALASVFLVALCLSGCGPGAIPEPTAADQARASERWPEVTLADLTAGRTLYVQKCSGCHSLYPPSFRAAEAWVPVVDKMASKFALEADQKETIARYLVVMSTHDAPLARPAD